MVKYLFVSSVLIFLFVQAFNKAESDQYTLQLTTVEEYGQTPEEMIIANKKSKKNKKKTGSIKYDGPGKFVDFHNLIRTREGRTGPDYAPNYKLSELNKSYRHSLRVNNPLDIDNDAPFLDWKERGPANVPGRTRGVLVMPNDPQKNTWLVGTVGGGIWKTTNGGQSWVNKTPNLPNLATTVLAISASNSDVIYAGTGEGFFNRGAINGDGIFKSIDGGDSWRQLSSTAKSNDFRNINRIVVNPYNPDILLMCANSGTNHLNFSSTIAKSLDGGQTWRTVYSSDSRIQQLIASPVDYKTIYATINGIGVIKTMDEGETWESSGKILTDGRIELAISPTKAEVMYAGAEGNASGNSSNLYISEDAGNSWTLVVEEARRSNPNWFGTQGWYNNCLAVHPNNPYLVYAGGIDVWKMEMKPGSGIGEERVTAVEEVNTESFFAGTNWGGAYFNGALGTGVEWFADYTGYPKNVSKVDYSSVEIRFGTGKVQKAHRFKVPEGASSGIAPEEYLYQDYVDVPFEVWDTKANRQLMISFRDQENDGKFNLEVRDQEDPSKGREYLFISSITYDEENPDSDIAQKAGMAYKNIYAIWPNLREGGNWNENELPESKITIVYEAIKLRYKKSTPMTDAYLDYGGINKTVHPDHHSLVFIPAGGNVFRLLSTNDGGVFISKPATNPGESDNSWEFAGKGLNTGQFYGFDKRTRMDEYIGGLQDNGTWKSPRGQKTDSSTSYIQQTGGDGFDVVWHYSDPLKIVTSSQYNSFKKSIDGGRIYRTGRNGLEDVGDEKAAFFARLENSYLKPDVLFTIGQSGVWKSTDFATNWKLVPIKEKWAYGANTNIKISLASTDVVWAGSAMDAEGNLHVSSDGGETFLPTNNYTAVNMGRISGLATHPHDTSVAYALFSFADAPKILRTQDLGETWEDISGFGKNPESSNGFPNVAVYSLLVLPHKPNTIWVGTEIGIVESKDNGETWALLNSKLPSVSIWALKVKEDQIVIATHGRGIWTLYVPELKKKFVFDENILKEKLEIINFPNPVSAHTTIRFYLTAPTEAKVLIHDLQGKIVEEILLGKQKRGQGFLPWNPDHYKKGVYILTLSTEQGTATHKMIIR